MFYKKFVFIPKIILSYKLLADTLDISQHTMAADCQTPNPLGVFSGDDITKPVEMFLQLVEVKAQKEGWDDQAKVHAFLDLIPYEVPINGSSPSLIWKQQLKKQKRDKEISWTEMKKSLLHTFGSKDRYSYQDKLTWFRCIGRLDDEDIFTFLIVGFLRCTLIKLCQEG